MKILHTFILLCFAVLINAQKVSDYRFIEIPTSFSGFEMNQYQLNDYLKIMLEDKKFDVLNRGSWPQEARLNPCQVLRADLHKMKVNGKIGVKLIFKDCNQTTVFSSEGVSNKKNFEEGCQEALRHAAVKLEIQKAESSTYRQDETKQVTIITTKSKNDQEILPIGKRTTQITKSLTEFDKFSYNGQTIYITGLDNNQFILTTKDRSKILAHYYPSALEGVYHVKVNTGNQKYYFTIGYYDGITLWYEYTDDNENWTKIEFDKID